MLPGLIVALLSVTPAVGEKRDAHDDRGSMG
jgi:hypothetical protein